MILSRDASCRRHQSIVSLIAGARAILLIGMCSLVVCAQSGGIDPDPGDPGTGGKNSIQGRIFVRGGGRLTQRAKVTLLSLASGEQFLMSDDNGGFMFRRVRGEIGRAHV